MNWLEDLGRDLRRAVRGLSRSAGFAATVALILALGIGSNTAMFSIVYSILLRPLPYADAGGIVSISESSGVMGSISGMFFSNRSMDLLQENADSFSVLAAYQETRRELSGVATTGAVVSPSMFQLLRASPSLGRLFQEDEALPGAGRVVLLSHRAWVTRFAADPDIIGTLIDLDEVPHTVVGVLAEGFYFPTPSGEFWLPYAIPPSVTTEGGGGSMTSIVMFKALGRLQPGVSPEQAGAEASSIIQERGDSLAVLLAAGGGGVRVVPLLEQMVGEYRPALSILIVVTVIVLLVACMNAAGLILARSAGRRQMLVISAALGASRGRIVRQLLAESAVLGLAGGVLGLTTAAVLLHAVPALAPGDVARLDEVGINGVVFAFTAGLSIVVGLLCGAGAAFQWSQIHLVRTLNAASARFAGGSGLLRTNHARTALSAGQVALAIMLLVGAGLLVRSFVQLLTFDRGFDPTNVITVRVSNPMGVEGRGGPRITPEVAASHQRLHERLHDEMLTRLQPLPDVEATGVSRHVPFGRNTPSSSQPRPVGSPVPSDPTEAVRAALQIVSPGYLDTLRFRLRAGRTFVPQDGSDSRQVMVVNETLERELFGDESAVGRSVILGSGEPWEVVGVVGDIVYGGLDLTGDSTAEAYFPLAQATESPFGFSSTVQVSVRTASGSLAVVPFIREAIAAANPQATIGEVTTMEEQLLNAVAWPRLYAFFVGSLAAIVLILAAVGIYGLLSHNVAQREREIGIRMALGAGSAQIVALVVRQGAALVGAGTLVGVAVAMAGSRVLESQLYGISADDLPAFVLAPLVLLAVALVACWIPARRATSVDPIRALRFE